MYFNEVVEFYFVFCCSLVYKPNIIVKAEANYKNLLITAIMNAYIMSMSANKKLKRFEPHPPPP